MNKNKHEGDIKQFVQLKDRMEEVYKWINHI